MRTELLQSAVASGRLGKQVARKRADQALEVGNNFVRSSVIHRCIFERSLTTALGSRPCIVNGSYKYVE